MLKHPFFKQAKKKDYLASSLLTALKPIQERARANTKRIAQRRGFATALKNEPILEESDWDFSSAGEESEAEALAEALEKVDSPTVLGADVRKGRFVVGSPTNQPHLTELEEGNQASIHSAIIEDPTEINS